MPRLNHSHFRCLARYSFIQSSESTGASMDRTKMPNALRFIYNDHSSTYTDEICRIWDDVYSCAGEWDAVLVLCDVQCFMAIYVGLL